MPNTISNANLRAQIWERQLLYEAMQDNYFFTRGLISTPAKGGNGIILQKDDLLTKQGNRITIGLAMNMRGEGIDGDAELKGHEEEMVTYDFSFNIDQKRYSIRLKGRMDEQRAAYDMRSQAKNLLKTWQVRMFEREIFRKLSGLPAFTFSNTPTAPSAGRRLFGGTATSTADIVSTSVFDTRLISRAKVLAKTEAAGRPIIEPLRIEGGDYYVCFIHEFQGFDLKRDVAWREAYLHAGAKGKQNPLFQDAYGIFDGVLVVPHPFVATFNNWGAAGNLPGARALLCGKQAVAFGFGERSRWNEETDDRGNKWVFTCGAIWGAQKIVFNDIDLGVIALDTFAANPA